MLYSLRREAVGNLFYNRHLCFVSVGFCNRKLLEVKLPDVLSQSRGRRKEKRTIQLLSGSLFF